MFAFKSDSIASTLNPISIPVNVIYKKDVFFEGGQMEPYILHLNAPPPQKTLLLLISFGWPFFSSVFEADQI